MMNCPSCGLQTLVDQQYCRSCCANLTADEPRPVNRRVWGLMMGFVGLLIAIAGKMLDQKLIVFVGAFVSVADVFFIAAYPLLRPLRKRNVRVSSQPESLISAEPTNKLPPMSKRDEPAALPPGQTEYIKPSRLIYETDDLAAHL